MVDKYLNIGSSLSHIIVPVWTCFIHSEHVDLFDSFLQTYPSINVVAWTSCKSKINSSNFGMELYRRSDVVKFSGSLSQHICKEDSAQMVIASIYCLQMFRWSDLMISTISGSKEGTL